MAIATLDEPQHMKALAHANEVRFAAARLKRDVKAGRLTIPEALNDPRAQCLEVMDLLISQPRWGRHRVLTVLTPRFISETKRVRDLTDRQRDVLADACR